MVKGEPIRSNTGFYLPAAMGHFKKTHKQQLMHKSQDFQVLKDNFMQTVKLFQFLVIQRRKLLKVGDLPTIPHIPEQVRLLDLLNES